MMLVNFSGTSLIIALVLVSGTAFAASDTFGNGQSVYGTPIPSQAAGKAMVVDLAKTKTLNMRCGNIVTFVEGGKTFSWKFDAATHRPVSLAKVAAAGFGALTQIVYVSRNDAERG